MNGQRRSGTCTQWNISHGKDETMPFAAPQMSLEITLLHKISQEKKDKYPMISFTGVI